MKVDVPTHGPAKKFSSSDTTASGTGRRGRHVRFDVPDDAPSATTPVPTSAKTLAKEHPTNLVTSASNGGKPGKHYYTWVIVGVVVAALIVAAVFATMFVLHRKKAKEDDAHTSTA